MKDFRIIILIAIFAISCHKVERPRIEKFIWIRHNLNWIQDINELKARLYLSYDDSLKKIFYAQIDMKPNQTEYFEYSINDSISELIYNNLYKKKFPRCLLHEQPMIYDGDFYCLIYKFENEPEYILNFDDIEPSDSLKSFKQVIEKLAMSANKKIAPFDIDSELLYYKDSIIPCFGYIPSDVE